MAGVLFWAIGKRAQGGKVSKNRLQIRSVVRQVRSVLINWFWLVSVTKIFEVAYVYTGRVYGDTLAKQMVRRCHLWPHPHSTMASGTQKAESCGRRRRKYNLVVGQGHPTEEGKEDEKNLPPGPMLGIQKRTRRMWEEGVNQHWEFCPFEHMQNQEAGFWLHSPHSPSHLTEIPELYDGRKVLECHAQCHRSAKKPVHSIQGGEYRQGHSGSCQWLCSHFLAKSQFCCHWIEQH